MTHRFSGSRKAPYFASSLIHVSLLALVGSGFVSCSAADPAPVGAGSQNGTEGEPTEPSPAALPDGVTMGTDANGNPIYTDAMGNVLEAVPVTNPDGSMGMVLQNPTTGSTVGMVNTTPPASTPTGAAGPVVVVDPEDDLIIMEPEATPIMDGDLVEGVVCNSAEVSFEPVIPTVMLLLDRSSSMFEAPYGTYMNRWEALRAAVALLEPYAAEVQFMGATYTSFNDAAATCPEMQGLEIVAATDNFADVLALVPETTVANPRGPTNGGTKGETPTAEAIAQARELLAAVEADGPKYLVIVTDGEPDTCVHFDPQCGQDQAVSEVQAAYTAGVQSIAIGISEDVGEKFLNDLAHAGVGADVEPPVMNSLHCIQTDMVDRGIAEPTDFYGEGWRTVARGTYGATGTTYAEVLSLQPSDATLGEQLAQVVEGVRSCSFEMEDNVLRAQAGKGAVQLQLADGTTQDLVYGDANGWDLDPTRDDLVIVQGTACTAVQDGGQVNGVKIEFPCEIRIPKAR